MFCFGRIDECEALWTLFRRDRNVLMLAPRRIGKTVLLGKLRETSTARGYRAVMLDVEGYHDERDFAAVCCAAIQEGMSTGAHLLTELTARLKQLVRTPGTSGSDWRQWLAQMDGLGFTDHLLAHLDATSAELPWLLLVDELPVVVQALIERKGVEAAETFLHRLRNLRQKYPRVRWIYAGSIGLDTVARRHRVEGTLSDLEVFPGAVR